MAYLHSYDDERQVRIRVEKILPAAASVAYPRCTRGRGEDVQVKAIAGDGSSTLIASWTSWAWR
jgi:hypothetical protein